MTVSYSSFAPPTGNVAPTLSGTSFKATFGTAATFTGDSCAPGEYRQDVKGTFKVNGTTLDHVLCGSVVLLPNVYQEDGCPSGSCTAYGHRSCPQDPIDQYLPLRATGCQFSMHDAPGFSNIVSGKTYNVDLSFQGKLIDTAHGGAVLISGTWTTSGSTTVTETLPETASVGLRRSDKFVGAHTTHNAESGATELHIVITRPASQPRLDASGMKLSVVDAAGRSVAPSVPTVYEVGGQARSTVSIVYTLPPGAGLPVMAELTANSGLVTLKVENR